MRNLAKLQKGEHILGLTNVTFEKDRLCSACQAGKQVGASHPPKNILTSSRPLKLLHMDLFGPVAYVSIGGNKYGLVIVDDFSRYTWVYFLQDKSEAQRVIKKFIRRAQNEFELKIKNIRSDNGSEFRNLNVEEYLDEEGIKHELSASYTPQQNGIVERKNRTLIEMARTMLDEYKTPDSFWAEAINMACHTVNRLYLQKYLARLHMRFSPVTSQRCITSESLVASVIFLTRKPKVLSLHLRSMKVFYLVMVLTNMPIVSSTKSPGVLR
jgi:transposase InsO family protein